MRSNGINGRNVGPILRRLRGGEAVCLNSKWGGRSRALADRPAAQLEPAFVWWATPSILKQYVEQQTIQSNGGALHHQPNAKAFLAGALGAKLR
jgi:hypothetical protein